MRSLAHCALLIAFAASPFTAAAQESEPWRHPHHRQTQPKAPTPSPELAPETSDEPEAEPYTVDPKLSPVGIQRWHPEAYDPGVPPEREPEIEYVARTRSPETRKRNKRIAIGVSVTVIAVLGIAVGTAVAISNFRDAWE